MLYSEDNYHLYVIRPQIVCMINCKYLETTHHCKYHKILLVMNISFIVPCMVINSMHGQRLIVWL